MTRTEAQQNHAKAMMHLEAVRAQIKKVGLSDLVLATKLHEEMLAALEAAKIAGRLRTQYAPAI